MSMFVPLQQVGKYDCVPIAMMNAVRWAGRHVPYRDIGTFRRLCRFQLGLGARHDDIINGISKLMGIGQMRISHQYGCGQSEEQMASWIREGNSVILNYLRNPGEASCGHVIFVSRMTEAGYVAHNHAWGKETDIINVENMRRILGKCGDIWMISRLRRS